MTKSELCPAGLFAYLWNRLCWQQLVHQEGGGGQRRQWPLCSVFPLEMGCRVRPAVMSPEAHTSVTASCGIALEQCNVDQRLTTLMSHVLFTTMQT